MIASHLSQLHTAEPLSHKGQNGKALIIGGSDLFHAASQWSFLVVSRWVDMTFYSSVAENNEILRDAKLHARDGVVVPRSEIMNYAGEADVILIGPGLRRDIPSRFSPVDLMTLQPSQLTQHDWENDTLAVTAALLQAFPNKKWVIDAGALQVLDQRWLPKEAILTPHVVELERMNAQNTFFASDFYESFIAERELLSQQRLSTETSSKPARVLEPSELERALTPKTRQTLLAVAQKLQNATLLVKGPVDLIWNAHELVAIEGGNAALTKGGTGDALAGLITAFRATSPALSSVVVASYLNKQAAHELFEQRDLMYNTTDLVEQLPVTWKRLVEVFR